MIPSPKNRFLAFTAVASTLISSPALAAIGDDFNDDTIAQEWSEVEDNAATLSVNETNQRLEVTATAPQDQNLDALYLSNGPAGFLVSTSQDFQLSIDYTFTSATSTGGVGSALSLVFGVGRDLDGQDSAAIAYGFANSSFGVINALGAAYRSGDQETTQPLGPGASSGTFRISYNAADDDLSLGVVGGPFFLLEDTVKTAWGANDLYVSLGARGSGFSTTGSGAFLDNFSVDTGLVSAVPEPSTNLLLALGGVASLAVFLRRRVCLAPR